jgi:hypothetical protein
MCGAPGEGRPHGGYEHLTPIGRDPLPRDERRRSISRGTAWLLERVGPTGEPRCDADETGHVYRLPYALALSGHRGEAARVLGWMERSVLDGGGDLAPGPMRDGFLHRWSSYPLALIALAAWHLERYDLATRILDTLVDFQDPEHGGAYAERPEVRRTARQDLFPTAQLGLTALATGRPDVAEAAFGWFRLLHALQPELPGTLYSATDGGRLITDPGEDARERFGLVTAFDRPRQAFYNPGIAAAFLGRYAAATGSTEASDLAEVFLELTRVGTEAQFDLSDSVQVCKYGWGAAVMLDLTGDAVHRDHAERMAAWFVAAQRPDGSWENSPFLMPDGATDGVRLEVTAEFVQHLIVIDAALEAGLAR